MADQTTTSDPVSGTTFFAAQLKREERMAWAVTNPTLIDALMSGEMVAVPKEPTGEMLVAASRAADNGNGSAGWGKVYRAMLAAARPMAQGGE